MKIGVTLRNMGPQSDPAIMLAGARRAETLGFESIWITDHIAIPPDDAEGSNGRYTDPLVTLAWLAGATSRIRLGTGVIILPYRPPLPTVKQIATLHELSNERLLLGGAVGWMDAEFRALGVDRHKRGVLTDEVLQLMADWFSHDVIERNGQSFIPSPQPPAPPVYIGGGVPHALKRALDFGHGWLPMARNPESLAEHLKTFSAMAAERGTSPGPVTVMTGLPLDDSSAAIQRASEFAELGIERLVCTCRYDTADDYARCLDALAGVNSAFQPSKN